MPDAKAWHPDVTLYEIHDKASGELIAHFYADLFPREGKFYHAAAFPLVLGHRRGDGSYSTPVSAIVANLTPPGPDRPSLLRHGPHGEIETLFHEFGHILHESLTRAQSARFSGAETERDFVEAPSQIMQHWVWQPSVLARFARHHETGEPLPEDLLARMIGSRYLNVGLRGAWQVSYGSEDMALHASREQVDIDTAMRQAFEVTSLPYPEGICSVASFGHLMGGYDAGYYGYLWAEVIGDDLWGRFMAEGITSPAVGMPYRRAILEPNGSRSGDDMVSDFLGRPASVENYLRMRDLAPVEVVGAIRFAQRLNRRRVTPSRGISCVQRITAANPFRGPAAGVAAVEVQLCTRAVVRPCYTIDLRHRQRSSLAQTDGYMHSAGSGSSGQRSTTVAITR